MHSRSLTSIKDHLTLEKRVYGELLRSIVVGRLAPGTQVTIMELASQLGVSLMPVRQALKALEAKNLIHIQRNRRLLIRQLELPDLEELFDIRLLLEDRAIRLAARRSGPETLLELERLLAEMETARDMETYLEKNREFHCAIYLSAGRPLLAEVIQDLWVRVSPYMYLYLLRENVKSHESYHSRILQALRARDPREASRWLRLHLQKSLQELTTQLRERQRKLAAARKRT